MRVVCWWLLSARSLYDMCNVLSFASCCNVRCLMSVVRCVLRVARCLLCVVWCAVRVLHVVCCLC